jgi:hypothetical protein
VEDIRDFTVLIDDDRYSVPNLRFVLARSEVRASQIADCILAESPHHHGVQVWTTDMLIYTAGMAPHPCGAHARSFA